METDAKTTRRPLRPERRSFDCLGAQVEVIDAEGVLRRPSDASVLRVDRLPASLRRLTMTVTVDGADVVFCAKATVARPGPSARQNPLNSPRARGAAAFGIILQSTKSPLAAAVVAAGAYAVQAAQDYRAAQAAAPSPTPEADVLDTLFIELHGHAWVVTVERSAAGEEYALWSRLQAGRVRGEHVGSFACAALWCAARVVTGASPSDDFYAGTKVVVGQVASPAAAGKVTLDDIGGLLGVVQGFRDILLSFERPDVLAQWGVAPPRGILLYGPPGTGKTMLTRALATELGADYVDIKVTEIMDKYMGQSEARLTKRFAELRAVTRRTVVVFDEFDTIISFTGGAAADAADQMLNAVAGVFKKELPRLLEETPAVVVVLTTNYRDRIDESLTRKGRIDRHIEIPRPDEAARSDIFHKKLTRLIEQYERPGFTLVADDVDVDQLARRTPELTGADIEECVRRAQHSQAMAEARGREHRPIAQADLLAAAEDVMRENR